GVFEVTRYMPASDAQCALDLADDLGLAGTVDDHDLSSGRHAVSIRDRIRGRGVWESSRRAIRLSRGFVGALPAGAKRPSAHAVAAQTTTTKKPDSPSRTGSGDPTGT